LTTTTEQLERLFALLEKGAISRAEFEQQKAELLAARRSGSESAPDRIGAYRILGVIGEGGMGTAFRGRHRSEAMADRQGGDVVVKVMHPHLARNPTFQARFEREANLGLKLDHPGVVKVHDLVADGDTLALVMDLVEGRSLARMIGEETGAIPWPRARPLFEQLLDAVEYAHSRGVIHRDLKPDNVLVDPVGRLRVLDFGIAREQDGTSATAAGTAMGTAGYMAPEQHTDARSVDARADVYALGMTLYEMLAGRLPWGPELDVVGVLQKKVSGDFPPPTAFYPDIPPAVVATVMRALAAKPERRIESVDAIRRALVAARPTPDAGPQGAGGLAPAPARARPTGNRRPGGRLWLLLAALGLGGGLLLLLVVGALLLAPGLRGERAAVQPTPVARSETPRATPESATPSETPRATPEPTWPASYGWTSYVDRAAGFSVELPDFFQRIDSTTSGARFRWGEATIRAWAVKDFSVEDLATRQRRAILSEQTAGGRITYRPLKENWYVVSGETGAGIFYEKVIVSGGDITRVRLEYPASWQDRMSPIVTRAARSLRPGA